MNRGDIHLAYFPFAGRSGSKLRPVLLLTGPIGPVPEFLTAFISSVLPRILLLSDLLLDPKLPEYSSSNLKQVSVFRLHKQFTIHSGDVVRWIGQLTSAPMQEVDARLRSLLNL